jgi:hypothetical protein
MHLPVGMVGAEVFGSVIGDSAMTGVELAMLVMIEVDELAMVELKFG